MNIDKFIVLQRAKCVICNDTVYGRVTESYKQGFFSWFKTNDGNMTLVDTNTVCTYTGITTSFGDKVFEGDVVLVKGNNIDLDFEVNDVFVVIYNKHHCAFCLYNKNGKIDEIGLDTLNFCFDDHYFTSEILGNVYDNPELVEGWKEPEDGEL